MTEMPAISRFWMVCRKPAGPHSKTEPRERFTNKADARRAARTLAKQTDAAFVILEAVEIVRPDDGQVRGLFDN